MQGFSRIVFITIEPLGSKGQMGDPGGGQRRPMQACLSCRIAVQD